MRSVKLVNDADQDIIITIDDLKNNKKYIYGIIINDVVEYRVEEQSRGIILYNPLSKKFNLLSTKQFDSTHETLCINSLTSESILDNAEHVFRFNSITEASTWMNDTKTK